MAEISKFNSLDAISGINRGIKNESQNSAQSEGGFGNYLKKAIDEVNNLQKDGDKAIADVASGQIKDLHQAAIAIGKAENSMKVMLEVKNKAIAAYKEILRTQV